jgi:hypothetical protein
MQGTQIQHLATMLQNQSSSERSTPNETWRLEDADGCMVTIVCVLARGSGTSIFVKQKQKKINFWLKTKLEIENMWCSMSPSKLHCLEAGKKAYCLDGISWNITLTSGVFLGTRHLPVVWIGGCGVD